MNDDELERVMRAGLQRRAEAAGVDPAVVDRARRAARRRRTTRLAVVGAAAVAVVATGVVAVALPSEDGSAPDPGVTDSADPGVGEWRTEYWHGVQVDVPADWGWGATPGSCGGPPAGRPYVGRPISSTDACSVLDPDATPTAPYVWLDAEGVEPGTFDFGRGWIRETVESNGSLVSVATHDPALRAQIIETITAADLCAPSIEGRPEPRFDNTIEGSGPFVSGRLCAYRERGLVFAEEIDQDTFEATYQAVEAAPEPRACDYDSFETVVLTGTYYDPYTIDRELWLDRDVVYDLTCGVASVRSFGRGIVDGRVTEETVPWAGKEFRHLLTGPFSGGGWVYERFIGMQG